MFQPIAKSPRLSEQIAKQIEEKIISRQLNPGDKLPSENDLVKQLECSRIAVREALRTLEGLGLITVKQGSTGGSFVKEFNFLPITDFLLRAIRLGNISIYHLSQFRLSFEPAMVRIVASKRIEKEMLIKLEANIQETNALYEKDQVTGYKNMDFHVLIAAATENPMFIALLHAIRANMTVITPIAKAKRSIRNSTLHYHVKIFDAIRRKKPHEAEQQMKRHLVELESLWENMEAMKAHDA